MSALQSSTTSAVYTTANKRWVFGFMFDWLNWTIGIAIPWQKGLTVGLALHLGPIELFVQSVSATAALSDYTMIVG